MRPLAGTRPAASGNQPSGRAACLPTTRLRNRSSGTARVVSALRATTTAQRTGTAFSDTSHLSFYHNPPELSRTEFNLQGPGKGRLRLMIRRRWLGAGGSLAALPQPGLPGDRSGEQEGERGGVWCEFQEVGGSGGWFSWGDAGVIYSRASRPFAFGCVRAWAGLFFIRLPLTPTLCRPWTFR